MQTAVHPAEVAAVGTAKVEEQPVKIRIYDNWGCPDATREIRDVLESRSCCSRTSKSFIYFYTITRVKKKTNNKKRSSDFDAVAVCLGFHFLGIIRKKNDKFKINFTKDNK